MRGLIAILLALFVLAMPAAVRGEAVPAKSAGDQAEATTAPGGPALKLPATATGAAAQDLPPEWADPMPPGAPEDPLGPVYDFGSSDPCPYCTVLPGLEKEITGLHWHDGWTRVGLREAIILPTLAVGLTALHFGTEQGDEPRWRGPILFDSAVRDSLVFDSRSGRETGGLISDVLFIGSIAHVTLDNAMVFAVRKNPDVAFQMLVINSQAYAMALTLNVISKRLFLRQRPYVDGCMDDPEYSSNCARGDSTASFYSGHATATATGAGLICAHHTQLQLYGDPLVDAGTCAFAIAMSAVTGVFRMTSDNHWATDVVTGYLFGYAFGYVVPTLLYYKEFRFIPKPEEKRRAKTGMRALIMPSVDPYGGFQLNVMGLM